MIIKKQESDYNMFDWWKKVVFDNYANFEGRARRMEFWYFRLVNFLIMFAVGMSMGLFAAIFGDYAEVPVIMAVIIFGIFALALLIPSLAVAVRRLHDTGKSGWFILLGIIPLVNYIGGLVLFVFYCIEGDRRDNDYGPDPKKRFHDEWDR